MSDIKVNNIQSLSGTNGPVISGTVEMNSTGAMSLPRGDTAYRGGRGRGVFGGGADAPSTTGMNIIDYITIATLGNALDFGDLNTILSSSAPVSSSTRGVFAGGAGTPSSPYRVNSISYITISATGNSFDFGDLTTLRTTSASCSNSTRGIVAGGDNLPTVLKSIDYITISTLANASNFGDLTVETEEFSGCSSPIRGIFGGGTNPGVTYTNVIEYVTISTLGDAQDFGNLTQSKRALGSSSSSIRAIFFGGNTGSGINTIEYVTIASLGDGIDFGDLIGATRNNTSCSSSIRGISAGGGLNPSSPAYSDSIEYVTIATLGNAADFGNLTDARSGLRGLSDSHGGLG